MPKYLKDFGGILDLKDVPEDLVERQSRRDKDWMMPPITSGLTFGASLIGTTAPFFSAAGTTGLSTETVDADGTRKRETDGIIAQAVANTARFQPYGVLVEPARTNLLVRSEDFATTWSATRLAVATNQIAAPDGNTTADKITGNGAAGGHHMLQNMTLTAPNPYSISCWFKDSSATYGYILIGGNNKFAVFNLTDGTVSHEDGVTGSVEDWGNGWYRCTVKRTAAGGDANVLIGITSVSNAFASSTAGVAYLWGAQGEAGATSTSYIPTVAASVTRAKDQLVYSAANNVDITAAGSVIMLITPREITFANPYFLDIWKADTDRIRVYMDSDRKVIFAIASGAGDNASITSSTAFTLNSPMVVGLTWSQDDCNLYMDGVSEGQDTSFDLITAGAASVISIGERRDGGVTTSSQFAFLLIYNRALSAAEIEYLTNEYYQRVWPGYTV